MLEVLVYLDIDLNKVCSKFIINGLANNYFSKYRNLKTEGP